MTKTDMKNVGEMLKASGSGVNVVNLALLVVIGWNARDVMNDTFSMVEDAVATVNTLKTDMTSLKSDVSTLKNETMPAVRGNAKDIERLRKDYNELLLITEKMRKCMAQGKRKCEV